MVQWEIMELLTDLDEGYINEAAPGNVPVHKNRTKWLLSAAVLAFMISTVFMTYSAISGSWTINRPDLSMIPPLSYVPFVQLTREEYMDYLGVDFDLREVLPVLTEEHIACIPKSVPGYFIAEDGYPSIDWNMIHYRSADGTQMVDMGVGTTGFLGVTEGPQGHPKEKLAINGVEVELSYWKDSENNMIYDADFQYKDIAFDIQSVNFSGSEFFKTLRYLLSR